MVVVAWGHVAAWAQNSWVLQVLTFALVLQTVRRLHDIDRTGWWIAGIYFVEMSLSLLPANYPDAAAFYWLPALFPLVALLVIASLPGSPGANRFGPPRRTATADQPSRIPDHPSH